MVCGPGVGRPQRSDSLTPGSGSLGRDFRLPFSDLLSLENQNALGLTYEPSQRNRSPAARNPVRQRYRPRQPASENAPSGTTRLAVATGRTPPCPLCLYSLTPENAKGLSSPCVQSFAGHREHGGEETFAASRVRVNSRCARLANWPTGGRTKSVSHEVKPNINPPGSDERSLPPRIVGFHPPACILALGLPEETQVARKPLIACYK